MRIIFHQITNRTVRTVKIADTFLLNFLESRYTTGSAKAAKTTATNKSNKSPLTWRNKKTDIVTANAYKNALFKSSTLVSPFGKFTII